MKKNQNGFTIIETLIVIVIAAAIMAGVFVLASTMRSRQRDSQRRQDIDILTIAIRGYMDKNKAFPRSFNRPGPLTAAVNLDISKIGLQHYKFSTVDSENRVNPLGVLPSGGSNVVTGDILTASNPASKSDISATTLEGLAGFMSGAGAPVQALPNPDGLDVLLVVSNLECIDQHQIKIPSINDQIAVIYQLESQGGPRCRQIND